MAPAFGFAHAATALSILALGLNVETRFRAGGLLTAQLSEPEPELTLGQLHGNRCSSRQPRAQFAQSFAQVYSNCMNSACPDWQS